MISDLHDFIVECFDERRDRVGRTRRVVTKTADRRVADRCERGRQEAPERGHRSRWVCSVGRSCLVKLLTRCDLSLPQYFIADEKHTHCLDFRVPANDWLWPGHLAFGVHDRQVGGRVCRGLR